jgi:hypothetical protein
MDTEQQSLSQTVAEAAWPYERYVSASSWYAWRAWMVILFACLGILFVLAVLFSAAFRTQADSGFLGSTVPNGSVTSGEQLTERDFRRNAAPLGAIAKLRV